MKRLLSGFLASAVAVPAFAALIIVPPGTVAYPTNKTAFRNYIEAVYDAPPFTLIALPDPHGNLNGMSNWISTNAVALNIKAVLGAGDYAEPTAGSNALYHVSQSVTGLLMVLPPGNHERDNDITTNRWYTNFNACYAWQTNQAGFAGSESNRVENTYWRTNWGGLDFLILALEFGPTTNTVLWASNIVAQFPSDLVILTTHDYLAQNGSHSGTWHAYNSKAYTADSNNGEDLWANLVRKFPNFVLTLNGHYHEAPYAALGRSRNDFGGLVTEVEQDYQGLVTHEVIKILTIDPVRNVVSVSTRDLTAGTDLTAAAERFSFELFAKSAPTALPSLAVLGTTNQWRLEVTSGGDLQFLEGALNPSPVATLSPAGAFSGSTPGYLPTISFPFDEGTGTTATNDAPLNLVLTAHGATTIWTNGVRGYACSGCTSNYFEAAHAATYSGWSELSMSAWIRVASAGKALAVIGSKHYTGTDGEWFLGDIQSGGSGLKFMTINDAGNRVELFAADYSRFDGTWHHVAASYRSGRQRLYLDGVLVAQTTSQTGRLKSSANAKLMVGNSTLTVYPFNGDIDEFKLWNRVLSDEEVRDLAADVAATASSSGTVERPFRLTFDEGVGTNTIPASTILATVGTEGLGVVTNPWPAGLGTFAADVYASNVFKISSASWNTGATNFTVAGWWKMTNATAEAVEYLASKHSQGNDGEWGFYLSSTRTWLQFFSVSNTAAKVLASYETAALNDYQWHHVAATMAGTVMSLYLDGVAVGAATNLGPVNPTTHPVRLGASATFASGGTQRWKGFADNFAYYTRALSAYEVAQLMRGERALNAGAVNAESLVIGGPGTNYLPTVTIGTLTMATNAAPANTNAILWLPVKIPGDGNTYKLPVAL
jgi:hypothetical protein